MIMTLGTHCFKRFFFTANTFADMWRIARDNIEKAQETLSKGGMFLLATITKGKMQNHTI